MLRFIKTQDADVMGRDSLCGRGSWSGTNITDPGLLNFVSVASMTLTKPKDIRWGRSQDMICAFL